MVSLSLQKSLKFLYSQKFKSFYVNKKLMIIQAKDQSLDGIFSYLYYSLGKEKYKKEITYWSTPLQSNYGGPSVLIDPANIGKSNLDNFHTIDQQNSFVAFHFQTHRLIVTDYTLMSRNEDDSCCKVHYPLTWKLEGSNDNETWAILHEQPSTEAIVGIGKKITLKTTKQQSFNNFKITNMGHTNHGATYFYFTLHRIELFGILSSKTKSSCNNKQKIYSLLFNIITIIIQS